MPALGSEVIDPTGRTTLRDWITNIPESVGVVNGVLVLDKPPRHELGGCGRSREEAARRRSAQATAARSIRSRPASCRSASARRPSSPRTCSPTTRPTRPSCVLGVETDTLDRTGAVTATRRADRVTREAIEARARRAHAASTIRCRRCTRRSSRAGCGSTSARARRRGGRAHAAPRPHRSAGAARVRAAARSAIAIACSKGTYVRSLVADLGNDLGCGAHMTELRRTRERRVHARAGARPRSRSTTSGSSR